MATYLGEGAIKAVCNGMHSHRTSAAIQLWVRCWPRRNPPPQAQPRSLFLTPQPRPRSQGCAALSKLAPFRSELEARTAATDIISAVRAPSRICAAPLLLSSRVLPPGCVFDPRPIERVRTKPSQVLVALTEHLDNLDVQQQGARPLTDTRTDSQPAHNTTHRPPHRPPPRRGHLTTPHHISPPCAGALALANLQVNSDEHIRRSAGAAIKAVVDGMGRFSADAELQEIASAALANLAQNTGNQPRAAAAGGLRAVVAAMRAHTDSVGAPWGGKSRSPSLHSTRFVICTATRDGPACLSTRDAPATPAGVQARGAQALKAFAADPDTAVAAGELGAAQALAAALWAHADDRDVAEQALGALGAMAQDARNQERVAEAGALEVLVGAMKQHLDCEAVQREGAEALANLAFLPANLARF